jgi:hypothetical protein
MKKVEEGICNKVKTDFKHRAKRKKQNASNWIIGSTNTMIQLWNCIKRKYKSWREKQENANHSWTASSRADIDHLYVPRK